MQHKDHDQEREGSEGVVSPGIYREHWSFTIPNFCVLTFDTHSDMKLYFDTIDGGQTCVSTKEVPPRSERPKTRYQTRKHLRKGSFVLGLGKPTSSVYKDVLDLRRTHRKVGFRLHYKRGKKGPAMAKPYYGCECTNACNLDRVSLLNPTSLTFTVRSRVRSHGGIFEIIDPRYCRPRQRQIRQCSSRRSRVDRTR